MPRRFYAAGVKPSGSKIWHRQRDSGCHATFAFATMTVVPQHFQPDLCVFGEPGLGPSRVAGRWWLCWPGCHAGNWSCARRHELRNQGWFLGGDTANAQKLAHHKMLFLQPPVMWMYKACNSGWQAYGY
ncbi:hypothetical protein RirG_197920 [Rhizophagus irregularis DAOM 197198w]|uniref:Uncharacterized protein n=1 Tax=Rhizophagus irregularis (strain DAOM 197198w) TaxID=1432141 RepID=A0A015KFP8_RHIIW|nr:hypothetical protein RirG_197920 [Rhizophagus irregularis DAOM 197198w]